MSFGDDLFADPGRLLTAETVADTASPPTVALAGTGTNIIEKDDSSAIAKRDNYVAVVSPVVAPDVASGISLDDILNDLSRRSESSDRLVSVHFLPPSRAPS